MVICCCGWCLVSFLVFSTTNQRKRKNTTTITTNKNNQHHQRTMTTTTTRDSFELFHSLPSPTALSFPPLYGEVEDEMMARRVCVSPTISSSDFKKLVSFPFLSFPFPFFSSSLLSSLLLSSPLFSSPLTPLSSSSPFKKVHKLYCEVYDLAFPPSSLRLYTRFDVDVVEVFFFFF